MNVELEMAWSPLVGVVVGVLLLVGILWSYRGLSAKARPGLVRRILALRILAALLLLLLALEPVVRADRLQAEDARVVVLLDRSASMATADSYGGRSRYEVGCDLLFEEEGLVETIEQEIPVSVYAFDSTAVPTDEDGVVGQTPIGALTDLAASLRSIASRDSWTAAVVLVSDGAHNGGGDVREAAAALPAPVFAVGLGQEAGKRRGAKDLAITNVDAPETALVNNAVLVEVTVRSSGYDLTDGANRTLRVSIHEGAEELGSETVEVAEDGLPVRVDLKVVPDEVRAFAYRVEVAARGDEVSTDNNVRTFGVEALDRRIVVLYVEGAARWEYKWIKTALQRDPNIQFTGLISTGPGTYLVQGERLEGGFEAGLPKTSAGYDGIDVVILGDIAADAFDETTLRELRSFVDRGGGLLALGGYSSFGPGGWGATPIAGVMPVVLDDDAQIEKPFTPTVTAEGREHPILKGLVDLLEGDPRPTLEGCSPLGRVKRGATVLLENSDADGAPVLVFQRFGEGRVVVFAGDTTFRWALAGRGGEESGLHELFHLRLIRALFSPEESVEKSGKPVVFTTSGKLVRLYEEVTVRARVRGEDGDPLEGAVVECTARGTDMANPIRLGFTAVPRLRGRYEARFRPDRPGLWILSGSARHDGELIDRAGHQIRVSSQTIESEDTGIRDDVLRAAAVAAGGRYYPLPDSGRIPGDILATLRDEMVREETRLWNAPLLFLLFTGLLAAEWVLRKRSHLL